MSVYKKEDFTVCGTEVRENVVLLSELTFVAAIRFPDQNGPYWIVPVDAVEESACLARIPDKLPLQIRNGEDAPLNLGTQIS